MKAHRVSTGAGPHWHEIEAIVYRCTIGKFSMFVFVCFQSNDFHLYCQDLQFLSDTSLEEERGDPVSSVYRVKTKVTKKELTERREKFPTE